MAAGASSRSSRPALELGGQRDVEIGRRDQQLVLALGAQKHVGVTSQAGPRTFPVTGDLAIGTDATAPIDDGCQPIGNVAGKIAMLTYAAQCNSQVTVNNAKAAGAIGVILEDGLLDIPRTNFGGSGTANLPGLVVGRIDGERCGGRRGVARPAARGRPET